MSNNARSRWWIVISLLAVLTLVASACGDDDSSDDGTASQTDSSANGDASGDDSTAPGEDEAEPADDTAASDDDTATDDTAASDDDTATDDTAASDDDTATDESSGESLRIAFLYGGPVEDAGYAKSWDLGREALEAEFGDRVETVAVEFVTASEEATRTIQQLIDDGTDVIVDAATLLDFASEAAASNPDVAFLRTDFVAHPNEATVYFETARPLYLKGVAAGLLSETDTIGYVAPFPADFVNIWINSYALGAQSVNPDIEVSVAYIGSFFDPVAARQASEALIDSGADALVTTVNADTVLAVAEERDVWAFGNFQPSADFAPTSYVTTDLLITDTLLIDQIGQILDGTWTGDQAYHEVGIPAGITLDEFGPDVPQDVQDEVQAVYDRMANEGFNPIAGPLADADGNEVLAEGEELAGFDVFAGVPWLVAGITNAG